MKTRPGEPPAATGAGDDDARAILELIAALMAEVGDGRGLGSVRLEASLERELGLGSLERVELVGRVEQAFGVRLGEEALAQAETPGQLLEMVRARRGGGAEGEGAEAARSSGGARGPEGTTASKNSSVSPAILTEPTRTAQAASDGPLEPPQRASPTPERARTLLEVLEYRALRDGARTHILLVREDGAEERITYADLRREAGAVAAGLRSLGLAPRGKVAIMLPTSRGYFAAFLGAMLAGGVPVPLYPPFRLDRIAEYIARQSKILANAEAEILVTFDRAARVAEIARDRVAAVRHVVSIERLLRTPEGDSGAIAAAVGEGDTALLQYTSGSTGDPKGVELTQANVLSNIRAAAHGVSLESTDVMVSWLPLYHDMGLIGGWLMNFYFGNPTVLLSPLTFLARPESWLLAITRHRGTRSVAPNFAFELCTRRVRDEDMARIDLRSLRTVLNGSEPITPATLERFAAKFAPVGFKRTAMFCAYGLAENMVAVAFPPLDREPRVDRIERAAFEREGRAVPAAEGVADALHFVACGSAVLAHEIRIADEAGNALPERRQGRLHFRGPSTLKGYYRNPEATAAVKLADGWVDSGDLAYVAGGQVHITGRLKDIIIKGGKNYYPHEMEAAAGNVTGVRTGCCAAFGVRDDTMGTEQIVLLAETKVAERERRESLAREVGDAVAQAVGVPPDRVVLVAAGVVPKTSSGKIRRTEARRLYLAGELEKKHGSFARQAASLYLRSIPARLSALARRAAAVAYGTYAVSVITSIMSEALVLSFVTPEGRPLRILASGTAKVSLGLAGLAPRRIGFEKVPDGPAVIVANHASYLDPFALAAALPPETRFVIKGECKDTKFFGQAMRRAGQILIDRHAADRSLEGLKEAAALLRAGHQVLIFPEGTFTRDAGLRPFKLGAFRLACETGAPVVPLVIRGTRRAFRDGMWIPRREAIELEVLEPLRPAGTTIGDIVRLRDAAADAMAARLDEPRLHVVPPGPASTT
jgi:1-acyl-sn-glycerol-3-phosphate acyltransferase